MKGYEILEQKYLKLYREDGIVPYEKKIGLLDFLRELNAGSEDLSRCSSYHAYPVVAQKMLREVVIIDILPQIDI